ncbi:MAG: hypothetical protein KA764_15165 [Anaerolineales bacterium]|nr:hypothetical protein [Anaerolineales bacterium]
MEWTVSFQAEPRILIVQTAGIADAASTLAMVKDLVHGLQEHHVPRCLIDHRALSGVSGGTFELYDRPAQVREMGDARRVKIAEVIRPEHAPHFKFLETVFRNRGLNFMVFHDYAAALGWLLPRPPDEAGRPD